MFTKAHTVAVILLMIVGAVAFYGYAGEPRESKKESSAFVDADGDGICDNRNTCTNACQAGKAKCPCQGSCKGKGRGACKGSKRCEGSR